jgi:hypothetical protein
MRKTPDIGYDIIFDLLRIFLNDPSRDLRLEQIVKTAYSAAWSQQKIEQGIRVFEI